MKIKDGIKLYPTKAKAFKPIKKNEPKIHGDIVRLLLRRNIIEKTKSCQYRANMFVIPKDNNSIRPIWDYSNLHLLILITRFLILLSRFFCT